MSNPKEIRQKILQELYEMRGTQINDVSDLFANIDVDDGQGIVELDFLVKDGMVEAHDVATLGGPLIAYMLPQITPKGVKLIEDGEPYTVIKLHEDTINDLRSLLTALMINTSLPEKEKTSLKKAIQNAPASAINEAVSKLVGLGVDSLVKTAPHLLHKLFDIL